jgi:hypothetical protein
VVTEEYGLWKGISTVNGAFRPTDGVFKSIGQRMLVGGIFCDMANDSGCV